MMYKVRTRVRDVRYQLLDWVEQIKGKVTGVLLRFGRHKEVVEQGVCLHSFRCVLRVQTGKSRRVQPLVREPSMLSSTPHQKRLHRLMPESHKRKIHLPTIGIQKEKDAWRRLGYTEAQIDWVFG